MKAISLRPRGTARVGQLNLCIWEVREDKPPNEEAIVLNSTCLACRVTGLVEAS